MGAGVKVNAVSAIDYAPLKVGKAKASITRRIVKGGRVYEYHATKGWRSYRAQKPEV